MTSLKAPKVLVVDDEPDHLRFITAIFRKHCPEFRVFGVRSGEEALKLAHNEHPDVAMLDVKMPGIDGFEVCRRMKASPDTSDIPILLFSGFMIEAEDRVKGLEVGADSYLCKPYEPLELVANIKVLLRIRDYELRLRKATDQEIAKTQARYQQLVETMQDVVYELRADGTVAFMSPAIKALQGYSPSEVIDQHFKDFVHPDDWGKAEKTLKRILAGEHVVDEFRIRTKSGDTVWVQHSDTPIKEGGKVTGFRGILTDITARKASEAREKRMSEGLRHIGEAVDELVQCSDLDSLYRRSVELAREKLGVERCGFFLDGDDSIRGTYGTDRNGETTDEHAYRDKKGEFWDEFHRRKSREGTWFEIERSHTDWDGEQPVPIGKGWIVITPILAASGKVLGVFTNDTAISGAPLDPALQDILGIYCLHLGPLIERRNAEEALRTSEERLRSIIENTEEVFYVHDTEHNLQYVSPRCAEVFGLPPEELGGKWTELITDHPMNEAGLKATEEAIRTGEKQTPYLLESRRQSDGAIRIVEVNESPVKDATGKVIGLSGALRDVTERVRAETALRNSEAAYRDLFANLNSGFAVHEMVCDEGGKPVDYRFVSVNPAFEELTGLKAADIVGRTVMEILPATEPVWIERYGRVVETGEPVVFEEFSSEMGKHYRVAAYRNRPGMFACIFTDITVRRRAEEEREHAMAELERFNQLAVGREKRMIELKRQINALLEELGRSQEFDLKWAENGNP